MTWGSTVPDALAALVAALQAAPDLAGVGIVDGPVVANASAKEVITIGREDENTSTVAIEGEFTLDGMAVSPSREGYSINCGASVIKGSADIAGARTRAYELLAAVGGVLAADPTLGGAVMNARLGIHHLTQRATQRGIVASVAFAVDCDAFTRR
jgi:hypothetical protein